MLTTLKTLQIYISKTLLSKYICHRSHLEMPHKMPHIISQKSFIFLQKKDPLMGLAVN